MGNYDSKLLVNKQSEVFTMGTKFSDQLMRCCGFCGLNRFTDQEVTALSDSNTTFGNILDLYSKHGGKGYNVSTDNSNVKLEFFVCNCESHDCIVKAFKFSGGQNKGCYYGKPDWCLEKATPFKFEVDRA